MLWKDWNMKTRIDKDRQSESENSNQLIKRSCGMLLDQWQCATDSTFFFWRDNILRVGETRRFSVDNTFYLNVRLTKFLDIYKICKQILSKAGIFFYNCKNLWKKLGKKTVRTIWEITSLINLLIIKFILFLNCFRALRLKITLYVLTIIVIIR